MHLNLEDNATKTAIYSFGVGCSGALGFGDFEPRHVPTLNHILKNEGVNPIGVSAGW
jgi:hypothetical protein